MLTLLLTGADMHTLGPTRATADSYTLVQHQPAVHVLAMADIDACNAHPALMREAIRCCGMGCPLEATVTE